MDLLVGSRDKLMVYHFLGVFFLGVCRLDVGP